MMMVRGASRDGQAGGWDRARLPPAVLERWAYSKLPLPHCMHRSLRQQACGSSHGSRHQFATTPSHVQGGGVMLGVGAWAALCIARLAQPVPAPAAGGRVQRRLA